MDKNVPCSSVSSSSLWSRIFDPICIIALISSIIYLYIYQYTLGFFDKLSIPYLGLNLPITFYIAAIYPIFYILKMLIPFIILLIILYPFFPYVMQHLNSFISQYINSYLESNKIKKIYHDKFVGSLYKCVLIYVILFGIVSALIFQFGPQMGANFCTKIGGRQFLPKYPSKYRFNRWI